MLGNFIYANPTKLYFGDEAQKNLVEALRQGLFREKRSLFFFKTFRD